MAVVKLKYAGESLLPIDTLKSCIIDFSKIELRQMPPTENCIDQLSLLAIGPNFFTLEVWHIDAITALVDLVERPPSHLHFHERVAPKGLSYSNGSLTSCSTAGQR